LFWSSSTSFTSRMTRWEAAWKFWNSKIRAYSLHHRQRSSEGINLSALSMWPTHLGSDSLGSHGLVRKLFRAR
jgi:hypothetical protein